MCTLAKRRRGMGKTERTWQWNNTSKCSTALLIERWKTQKTTVLSCAAPYKGWGFYISSWSTRDRQLMWITCLSMNTCHPMPWISSTCWEQGRGCVLCVEAQVILAPAIQHRAMHSCCSWLPWFRVFWDLIRNFQLSRRHSRYPAGENRQGKGPSKRAESCTAKTAVEVMF